MVAVRSGVGADLHVDAGDLSVLVSGHLHMYAHGVTGGVGYELLFPGVVAQNRAAGDEAGVGGDVLYQDVLLGAVASAYTRLDDVDLVLGKSRDPAHDPAHMVRNLRGGVDRKAAARHGGKADVRLKRSMLYLACLVGVLDYCIGMGECFIHVSNLALVACSNVLMDVRMERELVDYLAFARVTCFLVVVIQILGGAGAVFDYAVVDKRSSGGHGFLDGEDGRQDFVFHLDLLHRFLCCFQGFGYDGGNTVADVADLHVEESSVMGTGLGVALAGLHVVGLGRVECREDFNDTLHLAGLCVIYALDVRTGVRASEHDHVAGIGGDVVLDECSLTCYKLRAVDLRGRFSDYVELGPEAGSYFRCVLAFFHLLTGKLDCKIVVLVAGVADEDSGQGILDFFPARVGIVLKKPCQQERRSRCVVGTLHKACVYHGLLDYGKVLRASQAVRRADLASVDLACKNQVCVDGSSVHKHGIASAEALAVVAVAYGKITVEKQHLAQPHAGIHVKASVLSVNDAVYPHLWPPLICLARSAMVTARRYLL